MSNINTSSTLAAAFSNLSMGESSAPTQPSPLPPSRQALLATLPQLQTDITHFTHFTSFWKLPQELRRKIWEPATKHLSRFRLFVKRPYESKVFPSPFFDGYQWVPALASACAESIGETRSHYQECNAKDSSKLQSREKKEYEFTDVNVNFEVDVFVLQAAALVRLNDIGNDMSNFNVHVLRDIQFLEIDFHERDQPLQHVSSLNLFQLATGLKEVTLAVRVDRISSRSTMRAALRSDNFSTHLRVRKYLEKLARRVKAVAMVDSPEVIDFGAQESAIPVGVQVFLKLYGLEDSPPSILVPVEECLLPRFLIGY